MKTNSRKFLKRAPAASTDLQDLNKPAIKDRPADGYISFQDEARPVWDRNVRIKELK